MPESSARTTVPVIVGATDVVELNDRVPCDTAATTPTVLQPGSHVKAPDVIDVESSMSDGLT